MTQNLRDSIRVIVHVKKVWLAVRFNCKLGFILKNDFSQKLAQTDSTFNLVRGQCQANETLYFEMPHDTLLAKCKKIKLFVTMISANGMVPAGFVTFQTHPTSYHEQFQQTLPLSRCDDPKAQIKFIHLYQNCGKTSIQNSYISQAISRKDSALINNGDYLRGVNYNKTSYSVNRQNISVKKYKQRESTNYYPNHLSKISIGQSRTNFSGITPKKYGNIPRYSHINNGDSILNNQQRNNQSRGRGGEEKISQDRNDINDSSMNQLSRDQLLKENQEYWVEIVRMESEIQDIKDQNMKIRQENYQLKSQNQKVKEEYQANSEKIHVFVGKIQQNADVIRRLENEIRTNKQTIIQKEQFQKEYYKLVQILQEQQIADKKSYEDQIAKITNQKLDQINNYQNKLDVVEANAKGVEETLKDTLKKLLDVEDQNSRLRQLIETSNSQDKMKLQAYVQELQKQKQKIQFLQNQIKRQESENNHLKDSVDSQKQLNQFLQTSYQNQKIKTSQLEKQVMEMQQLKAIITSLQFDLAIGKHQKQTGQQQLKELNKQYLSQIQLRDQFQNAFSSLQIIKKNLQSQISSLNIQGDQNKFKISTLEKDLEIIQLKIFESQAVIQANNTKIEELTAENEHLQSQNKAVLQKYQGLESEFELMSQCLKQQQNQKYQMSSLLSTLQNNYSQIQDKLKNSQIKNEDLAEQLFKTQLQLRQQEQHLKSKEEIFLDQINKQQTSQLQLINKKEQVTIQKNRLLERQEGLQSQFELMSQCLKREQIQKEEINSTLTLLSANLQLQNKAHQQIAAKLQIVNSQLFNAQLQLKAKDEALFAESLKLRNKQAQLQQKLMELNQKNISVSSDLERAEAELRELKERQNMSADQYTSSSSQNITSLSLKQSQLQKENQSIIQKCQTISKEKEESQLKNNQFQKEREIEQNIKQQIIKEKDELQAIIYQMFIEKQQTKQIIFLHQQQKQVMQSTIQQQQSQKEDLAKKLEQKLLQINELKAFTHNKLQEHLKLMREVADLNKKIQNYQANINKVQQLEYRLRIKEKQIDQLTFKEKGLEMEKKQLLQKNEELLRELKFATEVLQNQRQSKSQIENDLADNHEKEIPTTEKQELPLIIESSLIKEQSIGSDPKVEEGVLQIQSKMMAVSEESISSQTKIEGAKKKKKKR